MDIGSRLKQVRETKRISGTVLADKVNVVPSQIYKIENGTTNPSLDLLQRICQALNITMAEFFSESNPPQKNISAPTSLLLPFQEIDEDDVIAKYKSLPEPDRVALARIIISLSLGR